MSKLGPTVPGQGCRRRARLNKEQLSQMLAHSPSPAGNVPAEKLGRQPKGKLLPGRRQRASGSKLPHKDTRGRGWRALPNQSATAAKRMWGRRGLSVRC